VLRSLSFFNMSKGKEVYRRRKHLLSEKTKTLSAAALAQKIGYLYVNDFPHTDIFESLPIRSLSPHRIVRCNEELLLISEGVVEIWHTHHDYLVKELRAGVLFGELSLLGQTMLGTKAIVGTEGATVSVMNADAAKEWIKASPILIVEKLGQRLADIESHHYRSSFQLVDSRLAALLLELAGEGSTIDGLTHEELGEKIGVYRETVTNTLQAMKVDKLIEIRRKRIIILNKKALRELSEM
jgi:CRP-like cAMP-binding protein